MLGSIDEYFDLSDIGVQLLLVDITISLSVLINIRDNFISFLILFICVHNDFDLFYGIVFPHVLTNLMEGTDVEVHLFSAEISDFELTVGSLTSVVVQTAIGGLFLLEKSFQKYYV